MRFWDTVALYQAVEVTDADGTPVHKGPAATGTASPAVVQPLTSTEETDSGERVTTGCLMFLPPDTDVDPFSYASWNGALYEIDGEPARYSGPRGPHHIEAMLRRVR